MCNRQQVAENVMDMVKQNPPLIGALHRNGKLLSDSLGDNTMNAFFFPVHRRTLREAAWFTIAG